MKIKTHFIALMLLFSGVAMSTQASAKNSAAATTEQQQVRVAAIKERVEEIKNMNVAQMNSSQRKEVRHELKDMKQELKAMDPTGIYISGGALLIIIIVLLILFL